MSEALAPRRGGVASIQARFGRGLGCRGKSPKDVSVSTTRRRCDGEIEKSACIACMPPSVTEGARDGRAVCLHEPIEQHHPDDFTFASERHPTCRPWPGCDPGNGTDSL